MTQGDFFNNPDLNHQVVVDSWNEMAEQNGLRKVRVIDEEKHERLDKLLRKKWWREHWREALDHIPECPELLGRNTWRSGKPWKANFRWFLNNHTVAKILDGTYDDKESTSSYTGNNLEGGMWK